MVATTTTNEARGPMKTEIHITRSYPHPRTKVWRAVTEPALVEKWLMRPEGLATTVGTKFKLVSKPQPGWRGWVECEVLEVVPERRFVYSWVGQEKQKPMTVSFTLEDEADGGTRLTLDHVGFEGIGGWVLARIMMGPGWKKMMTKRLAAVLAT
jgi:uncharacterized protein YndB with AHSA1/START domain